MAKKRLLLLFLFCIIACNLKAQSSIIHLSFRGSQGILPLIQIEVKELDSLLLTDENGQVCIEHYPFAVLTILVKDDSYAEVEHSFEIVSAEHQFSIYLVQKMQNLEEVVISGTMKPVSKLDSPVPVEVYTCDFFKTNPTATIFDGLQLINGVRPQVNCNICSTGDIHINGLEGPYTMILIDGMPIVGGLSTIYGMNGIPQSMIDRVEVVKGPASALYGSEAVGGLINIITKKLTNSPRFAIDMFGTSWGEINADISTKFKLGKKVESLLGVNYFNYSLPKDVNGDGFTDLTLQHRISVFNKWNFKRKSERLFSIAGRYVYEDRWGGQMNWTPIHRGKDSIYGESIYTSRWELFGGYQLPLKEKVILQYSANGHEQNSVYGTTFFKAKQFVSFLQLSWSKQLGVNDLLVGVSHRFTWFDDNTVATSTVNVDGHLQNAPSGVHLPGFFVQDELKLANHHQLLVGARYDYNFIHGSVLTPRINYKWNSSNRRSILRLGVGNGFRVANIVTEDHAALTGARELIFANELKPEKSWNATLNITQLISLGEHTFLNIDANIFYTHFTNKIIPDYDSDVTKIIYDNLDGYAVSKGVSINSDWSFMFGLKLRIGATWMDVSSFEDGKLNRQLFSERFTGVWSISYPINRIGLTVDYTGNIYSPMLLPTLGELDPRPTSSSWWSIQNIQLTKSFGKRYQIYGGVKNLLNWTPAKNLPFLIARSHDPFDKNVSFDEYGNAIVTPENPYALTFDPTYVYAPNQGIRVFVGFRINI